MKELIQNILESAKERIKSPFVGSYILSFIFFNWDKISIYLFSQETIENRIKTITENIDLKVTFLFPLFLSIFYIIVLPYLNVLFECVSKKAYKIMLGRLRKENIETLNHKIDEAKLERKISVEKAGTKEIETMNSEISSLKNELEIKSKEMMDERARFEESYKDLDSKLALERNDTTKYKERYNSLEESYNTLSNVYNLLIRDTESNTTDISKYLRNNLSNDEIIRLKQALNSDSSLSMLPFERDIISLLLKAKYFTYNEETKTYNSTDSGKNLYNSLV